MNDVKTKTGFDEKVREELRLRNYSHKTIKAYLSCLRNFIKYFQPKHPGDISNDEIRKYLISLLSGCFNNSPYAKIYI